MNLSGVYLPFFFGLLFWIFVDSCCIGHLLHGAPAGIVSRDTGVEVARWGTPAPAYICIYVGVCHALFAAFKQSTLQKNLLKNSVHD